MVEPWENLRRFLWCRSSFCCYCYSSFVDVLYSHFLFDIILHPSVDYRQVFKRILYFQSSPTQSDSRHFHFSTIPLSFSASTTVLSGHFLATGTFPTFWQNLLLSKFPWEPAVTFLKVAGLHTDPRNTDPAHLFVWFTVIHNLLYILSLYLCMSILQKFYLRWKLWWDQQPHNSAAM